MFEVAQELNLKISIVRRAYVLAMTSAVKRVRRVSVTERCSRRSYGKNKARYRKRSGFNFSFPGQVLKRILLRNST